MMKRRLVSLGALALFWLVFFYFARLFFILTHNKESFQYSLGVLIATFSHGIRLDLSATAYILIIPFLFSVIAIWIRGDWFRQFMRWYTLALLLISSAIIVGDSVLYTYWGFRMDYTPLLYLKTPREAAASVSTAAIAGLCCTIVILTLIFFILYRKYVDRLFSDGGKIRSGFLVSLLFLVLTGALLIPIRGGVGIAPINAGTVYFNKSMFVNHAAINVVWNVGSSYFNRKPSENPYNFGDLNRSREIVDSLTVRKGRPEKVLNTSSPDILLIILESFGNSLIGPLGGDSLTTPCLNKLIKEGLVFSNFYASGNRTDKALPAILDGYPAQPATSIIKEPKKSQTLPSLVRILSNMGYKTSFWYGGDINFANFNSFVITSGFNRIITKDEFDPSTYNSKWGVHDHVLFGRLKDSMAVMEEPFLRVVLTLSSHEPFEVPMKPVFEGTDEQTKFKNSVFYTDKTIGAFIDWAKGTTWWNNTLVILVADHCRRNSLYDLVYSQQIFKIPMLWLGGALEAKGRNISKVGSQVDIPLTLLDQMETENDFPFSKDLLSEQSNSFAFYTFNEGFAFITDSSALIYDHKLGRPVVVSGRNAEKAERCGKAYLQVLYDDYMNR
jgi:phosphoglycerol transferase MdoB-like AlkP superfamily enzyme